MFELKINSQRVLASKFFSNADTETVLAAIPKGTERVVFLDTPATPAMMATVKALVERDISVIIRDHHDISAPRNPREAEIARSADILRRMVGVDAMISTREVYPACSTLVEVGEFLAKYTIIVADPDADGLTAAMKASYVTYMELDADAAILDGARSEQTAENLSPLALLLVKGLATLPAFNADRPQVAEEAKRALFQSFADAVSGDQNALDILTAKVKDYEESVKVAESLATTLTTPIKGVAMVNAVGSPRYDLSILAQKMEAIPGTMVTVVRKDNGPIAGKHGGVQISLAVVKGKEINLQDFLPAGFTSSPEAGIISNTTFLLHLSEKMWQTVVLPAMKARFNA